MRFLLNLFRSQTHPNIEVLTKEEFKKRIDTNTYKIIDVRTPLEFEKGHIQGAFNFNIFNQQKFLKEIKSLNKKSPVCVYCQSGNRSRMASKIMIDLGFEKVYDLKGGYANWVL